MPISPIRLNQGVLFVTALERSLRIHTDTKYQRDGTLGWP
jgi:hypothetical protein